MSGEPTGFCGTCGHGRVMHRFGSDGTKCLRGEHTKGGAVCDCTNWTDSFADTNDARFATQAPAEVVVQPTLLGVVNDDY